MPKSPLKPSKPENQTLGEEEVFRVEIDPEVINMSLGQVATMMSFLQGDTKAILSLPTQALFTMGYACAFLRNYPGVEGMVKEATDDAYQYLQFVMEDIQPGMADVIQAMDDSFAEQKRIAEEE